MRLCASTGKQERWRKVRDHVDLMSILIFILLYTPSFPKSVAERRTANACTLWHPAHGETVATGILRRTRLSCSS